MKSLERFGTGFLFLVTGLACAPEMAKQPATSLPSSAPVSPSLTPSPSSSPIQTQPTSKAVAMSIDELTALGWKIPANQSISSVLPPQLGTVVDGVTVARGGPGNDTDWTAFTLVLFLNENGKYEVLTQMRAIAPVGHIEAPGGHLTGGQTWAQGASAELAQEAGITVDPGNFIYLVGGKTAKNDKGELFGNTNFVVVLKGQKPATTNTSNEVDKTYGHQWIDLKTLYDDIVQEQRSLVAKHGNADGKKTHGKYYSFFRGHVMWNFCQQVIDCKKL